jgi:hypothetical protein
MGGLLIPVRQRAMEGSALFLRAFGRPPSSSLAVLLARAESDADGFLRAFGRPPSSSLAVLLARAKRLGYFAGRLRQAA